MHRIGTKRAEPPRCSFCNKPQEMVRHLVAGPTSAGHAVYICDECHALVGEMMAESERAPSIPELGVERGGDGADRATDPHPQTS